MRANVKNVFHNAENGHFEADVTLHERGEARTFAVSLRAPIDMDFATLRPALVTAAKQQRQFDEHVLIRRTQSARLHARTARHLDRILFSGPRYLDEILTRAA
ncbi:MAG: hypothetical protein MK098_11550 [Marinovum sp.]|nr:hypothetical protein [Marinovum sp.]